MKAISLMLAVAAMVAGLLTPVPVKAQDQLVASICEYVQKNDKSRLRKQLKQNRLKLRNIYSGISCNGLSLLRFAMKNNADAVGKFMVKKLPASELAANGDYDWATANGYGDSAIAAAIKARAGL